MNYITFEEAIQAAGIPLPTKAITHDSFTRWGKKIRYSAKRIGDGGYLHDFKGEVLDILWFPNSDKSLTPTELKVRKALIDRAKKDDEAERAKLQEIAALEAELILSEACDTGSSEYLNSKKIGVHGIYFSSNKERPCIIIPAKDIDGKLCTVQRIYDDGGKYFLKDARKTGCFHVIGEIKENEPILFAEGYATGATIYEALKKPVVICFDAGNLEAVIKAFRPKYPGIKLIIAGDNDAFKKENTGKLKAEEAAGRYSCTVVLPEFSENLQQYKPTDFNDLMIHEGMEVVKAQVSKALKLYTVILPAGFRSGKSGLFFQGSNDNIDWVCSPIEIVACTRDENSENWGRLIRFQDLDNRTHERAIPMELLSGDCSELYGLLLNLGLRMSERRSIRSKIPELLQTIILDKRALCTTHIGWHGDHFITPDGAIPATDTIYLQSDNSNFVGFRYSGTLEEWIKNVAIPCRGNSRLVFSLCCAFAAPLLPLLNAESGGFNLKGASSIGKSTALATAASVVGSQKYIQHWKATSNALEAVAEARNHSLLCLDELGQVDGKEAGEITYMLANGSGKSRMKAAGGLRKKLEWEILFLSTGEVSISDKLNEVGKKAQAGMVTRIVDIPADAGKGYKLFDTIHDFKDGGSLARHLKYSVSKYYGTAIRLYLAELAKIKAQLPNVYEQIKADFFSKYVSSSADSQVHRVASRFAIVVAAGQLAVSLGILPYTIEGVFEAVGICFNAWLEDRGGDKSYELDAAIRQVRSFFEVNHSSRFASMGMHDEATFDEKIINQAGYKRKTPEGSYEFFVYPETFRKEICNGHNHKDVSHELYKQGCITMGADGKFQKTTTLPFIKQKRMYHFTSAILQEVE